MSDGPLQALIAQIKVFGFDDATIEAACRDPSQLAFFKAFAEKNKSALMPQAPKDDDNLSGTRALIDRVKAAYEREKNAPLRKPAARPRYEMLSSWEMQRQGIINRPNQAIMHTFMGLPKKLVDEEV
ncbi:hypothetical protein JCM16303_006751 [Sporobolomyces ruberrimus]